MRPLREPTTCYKIRPGWQKKKCTDLQIKPKRPEPVIPEFSLF